MDNRPIGILDSGMGGLTAMRALHALLPEENIIYFGDTGRLPYGAKSRDQVRRMARQDLDLVGGYGVKAVIVACGTISSNAPDLLDAAAVPTLGVLRAGVEAMARLPGEGPLGVIATQASIRSGAFEEALRQRCPGREVLPVACPAFVPLIEAGLGSDAPQVREAVALALRPLKEAGVQALLLGCTHYGIIGEAISAYLGGETALVSASACAAEAMAALLRREGLTGGEGKLRFLASGSPEEFAARAGLFLGYQGRLQVEQAPIMEV